MNWCHPTSPLAVRRRYLTTADLRRLPLRSVRGHKLTEPPNLRRCTRPHTPGLLANVLHRLRHLSARTAARVGRVFRLEVVRLPLLRFAHILPNHRTTRPHQATPAAAANTALIVALHRPRLWKTIVLAVSSLTGLSVGLAQRLLHLPLVHRRRTIRHTSHGHKLPCTTAQAMTNTRRLLRSHQVPTCASSLRDQVTRSQGVSTKHTTDSIIILPTGVHFFQNRMTDLRPRLRQHPRLFLLRLRPRWLSNLRLLPALPLLLRRPAAPLQPPLTPPKLLVS